MCTSIHPSIHSFTYELLNAKNARDPYAPLSDFSCRSKSVTLTNFALSKHLVREDHLLSDQRGSLAYVSPDILSGERERGREGVKKGRRGTLQVYMPHC